MLQADKDQAPGTHSPLLDAYRSELDGGWLEDPFQENAVAHLNQLLIAMRSTSAVPKGLYLHGPVGRGKSKLLTLFAEHAEPIRVRRTHMHSFMEEVHERLHAIKGGDPIQQIAKQLAGECRVLGFDEFYVTNIADGILLSRLFQNLFKNGVVVVSTSNWPLDDLFQGGRNRKSFLPFIRLLKQHMREVDLGNGVDYRQPEDPRWPLYVLASPDGSATARLEVLFDRYRGDGPALPAGTFRPKALAGRAGWYRFSDICEASFGRKDYLALIQRFDTLLIEDVPAFHAPDSDAALRFVTLIDICYAHNRRVIVSAEAYPDHLYVEGPVSEAFRRASSRLAEMQSWGADALPRAGPEYVAASPAQSFLTPTEPH